MRPWVGNRDTLVEIQSFSEVTDPDFGTTTKSWVTLGEEWCEVRDYLPSRGEQQINAVVNMNRRPTRVRMLYRTGMTSKLRMIIRGETYEIVAGPAELGRRDGLEFVCEVLSVSGVPS